MELGAVPFLLGLVTSVYLAIFTSQVSGKCRGKWASHACLGGNGKRSDPGFASTGLASAKLRDILMPRDFQPSGTIAGQPGVEEEANPIVRLERGLVRRLVLDDVTRLLREEEAASNSEDNDLLIPREMLDTQVIPNKRREAGMNDLDTLRTYIAALRLKESFDADRPWQ